MTQFKFQRMPEADQLSILYNDGVYIGKRREGRLTILLFQVDSFYVEVFYKKYRKDIEKILYSRSTDMLDPYLEQINPEYFEL
jgi:hypothetical protein